MYQPLHLAFECQDVFPAVEAAMKTNRSMRNMLSSVMSTRPTLGRIRLSIAATHPFRGNDYFYLVSHI